jgi:FKBP-type peptidyl-prolyl cis-trans isomerase
MKKYLFVLSMLVLGFTSCVKDKTVPTVDPAVQAKIDDDAIKAYLVAHPGITAIKDPSGLYYQVITEGTGAVIDNTSTVKVSYVGTTLQGVQFDANEDYTTALAPTTNIIEGWKIGVPKAKVGGKILLIIPSALAYGPYANGAIAANSIILFTITVKELIPPSNSGNPI